MPASAKLHRSFTTTHWFCKVRLKPCCALMLQPLRHASCSGATPICSRCWKPRWKPSGCNGKPGACGCWWKEASTPFFAWNYRMLPSCPPVHPTNMRALDFPVWVMLLAAAITLAGCNATAPQAVAAPVPPMTAPTTHPVATESPSPNPAAATSAPSDAIPVLQVLAQTDRTLRMAPAELAKEIARLGEAEDASVETPLLLATALAQTRQPVDTARALGLVQRVMSNTTTAAQALHPLARLMESRLLQQRRLEDQLERQGQQLREAQRRNDQLNERLEAVRAIERSLTTRPGVEGL